MSTLRARVAELESEVARAEEEVSGHMHRAEQAALARFEAAAADREQGVGSAESSLWDQMPDEVVEHHVLPFREDTIEELVVLSKVSVNGPAATARSLLEEISIDIMQRSSEDELLQRAVAQV